MGMDLAIYSAPNHEIFKHEDWYEKPCVKEEFYSRKAWHYPEHCSFLTNKSDECGKFIKLSKKNIKEMIRIGCEYPNYWGNYKDVPKLCKLRDKYDKITKKGRHLYLEYDY